VVVVVRLFLLVRVLVLVLPTFFWVFLRPKKSFLLLLRRIPMIRLGLVLNLLLKVLRLRPVLVVPGTQGRLELRRRPEVLYPGVYPCLFR
jgi:hypothetical protein